MKALANDADCCVFLRRVDLRARVTNYKEGEEPGVPTMQTTCQGRCTIPSMADLEHEFEEANDDERGE